MRNLLILTILLSASSASADSSKQESYKHGVEQTRRTVEKGDALFGTLTVEQMAKSAECRRVSARHYVCGPVHYWFKANNILYKISKTLRDENRDHFAAGADSVFAPRIGKVEPATVDKDGDIVLVWSHVGRTAMVVMHGRSEIIVSYGAWYDEKSSDTHILLGASNARALSPSAKHGVEAADYLVVGESERMGVHRQEHIVGLHMPCTRKINGTATTLKCRGGTLAYEFEGDSITLIRFNARSRVSSVPEWVAAAALRLNVLLKKEFVKEKDDHGWQTLSWEMPAKQASFPVPDRTYYLTIDPTRTKAFISVKARREKK